MRIVLALLAALALAAVVAALLVATPSPEPPPTLDGCPARLADCERRCSGAVAADRLLRCLAPHSP